MLENLNIEKPKYIDGIVKYNATLEDTLKLVSLISSRDSYQVKGLAEKLKAGTVEQTAHNIWNFLKSNIPYKEDTRGTEQVRTPARVIEDAKNGIGVDCDCMTTLVSAILKELNIKHYYKVVAWQGDNYAHIYPVAIDNNGNEYAIDGIPEIIQFNVELPYSSELKFNQNYYKMDLQELNGTVAELEEKQIADDFFNTELSGANTDEDSEESLDKYYSENYHALMGNYIVVDDEQDAEFILAGADFFEGIFYKQTQLLLSNLRKEKENPTFLSKYQNTEKEIAIAETVLVNWKEDILPAILTEAIQDSDKYKDFYIELRKGITEYTRNNELNGVEDFDIYLKAIGEDELNELELNGSLDGWFKKAWNKVKTGLKKAGKKVKNGLLKVGRKLHRVAMFPARATVFPILRAGGGILFLARYANPADLKKSAKLREKKRRADFIVHKLVRVLGYNLSKFDNLVKAGIKTAFGGVDKAFARLKRGKQLYGTELNGELGFWATAASAVIGLIGKLWKFIQKIFKKKPKDPKLTAGDFANGSTANNNAGNDNNDNAGNDDYAGNDYNDNAGNNSKSTRMSTSNTKEEGGKTKNASIVAKAKEFTKKHKTTLIIVSIVIVLLIVGFVFWKKSHSKPKKRRSVNGRQKALNGTRVVTSTSVKTIDTGKRLKQMHRIAKRMRKQYPNAKYSTLLKKASKELKK